MDLRPDLATCFWPFAVPATVTPRGGAPITADVIPPSPGSSASTATSSAQTGSESAVIDLRPRFRLRRDQVPVLPIGSRIVAPVIGGGATHEWIVDRVESTQDPEVWDVLVH